MTTARSYFEKLRDPRWQKKRLHVLERDGWTCGRCTREGVILNVHHGYYERGRDPWDYPEDAYETLCEECHGKVTELLLSINKKIGCLGPVALLYLDCLIGELRGADLCDAVAEDLGYEHPLFNLSLLVHQLAYEQSLSRAGAVLD